MASHKHRVLYDKALMHTPEWDNLYSIWTLMGKKQIRGAFEYFMDLYNWAMQNGFICGAILRRHDESKPCSPDNCYWSEAIHERAWNEKEKASIRRFDETVGKIRAYYGMKPLVQEGAYDL